MTSHELLQALLTYGDHKEYCSISGALETRKRFDLKGLPYPACTCGWTDLVKQVRKNT